MKAIAYLQKLGAIPPFDPWDLKMSIVVIADELFMDEATYELDLSLADHPSKENLAPKVLEQWSNLVQCSTKSDIPGLAKVLENIDDTEILVRAIEKLLELRLFYFSRELGVVGDRSLRDEKWFTMLYNDFAGLNLPTRFKSKSEIVQFYCSGAITEIGEKALEDRKVSISREG